MINKDSNDHSDIPKVQLLKNNSPGVSPNQINRHIDKLFKIPEMLYENENGNDLNTDDPILCQLDQKYDYLKLVKQKSSSEQRLTHQLRQYEQIHNPRIWIVYKQFDAECPDIVRDIVDLLHELKCQVYLEEPALQEINKAEVHKLSKEILGIITMIVTIGGDGTILYALKQMQGFKVPPILAFEKGTLGFMCIFDLNDRQYLLKDIVNKFQTGNELVHESKMRLHGELYKDGQKIFEYDALNEFVISRGSNPHCLYLEIVVNDKLLTVASGDGLIISTPTGSTAYFLSAGGPIIENEVNSIGIAPICPLSLSFRPIVLPPCMRIKIKLQQLSRAPGFICADGQHTIEFTSGMEFNIVRSQQPVSILLHKADDDYSIWLNNLSKKLRWNKIFNEKTKKSKL